MTRKKDIQMEANCKRFTAAQRPGVRVTFTQLMYVDAVVRLGFTSAVARELELTKTNSVVSTIRRVNKIVGVDVLLYDTGTHKFLPTENGRPILNQLVTLHAEYQKLAEVCEHGE